MIAFLVTSLILELTPGPNMAYLAAVALAQGRRAALMAVAGIASGLAVIGVLAALGLAAAIEAEPRAYAILRYGGAIFLLWLAYDAWRESAEENPRPVADWATFGRAFLTNILNPKAALFYISVLPDFVDPARPDILSQNLRLVAIYVGVATAVHAAIALFAANLRGVLVAGPRERLVRRSLAVALALVAVWFLWKTRA